MADKMRLRRVGGQGSLWLMIGRCDGWIGRSDGRTLWDHTLLTNSTVEPDAE